MSSTFAAYHLATLGDFRNIGVIFAHRHDPRVTLPGVNAVREARVAGAAYAVANAIRHVTIKRGRRALPTPLGKLST